MGYTGTVYLFGFIPIYRGLYASCEEFQKDWKLRWYLIPVCSIKWKPRKRMREGLVGEAPLKRLVRIKNEKSPATPAAINE